MSTSPSPAEVYSPPLWGNIVASILTGISISQFYVYIFTSADNWRMKAGISFLVCVEIVSTLITTLYLRDVLIDGNQDIKALFTIPRYFFIVIFCGEIIPPVVQSFIGMQIYIMNRRWLPVSIVIWVCALAEIAIGILLSVWTSTLRTTEDVHASKYSTIAGAWNVIAGFVDILATIGLCMLLKTLKTRFKTTKDLVNYIVVLCANRGVLLIIFQFIFVAFWFGSPNTLLWMPFYLCLGKIYVVTLLAILNMRRFLREKTNAGNAHSLGTLPYTRNRGMGSRGTESEDLEQPSTVQGVKVSRVTELTFDGYEGAPTKHGELGSESRGTDEISEPFA